MKSGLATLLIVLLCSTAGARQPWLEWKNCALDENASNDGDSFHVKAGHHEYICRLYFVDAPETDNGFPDRVAEQGSYFGITPAQAVELGKLAKKFTEEKLSQPFTIRTCKQNAMGRSNKPRYYSFIETSEGDLGELLVANGMARVHGVSATPLGLAAPGMEKQKLQRLEREAKEEKIGGWGASGGRMKTRLTRQPARSGPDSFDAFFHPERLIVANQAVAAPDPVPPAPTASLPPSARKMPAALDSGKLDPNTATPAQLMAIKGVGPVLAGRIVEARPFKNADELRRVKGVGVKTYAKIRPYFAPSDTAVQ